MKLEGIKAPSLILYQEKSFESSLSDAWIEWLSRYGHNFGRKMSSRVRVCAWKGSDAGLVFPGCLTSSSQTESMNLF